MGEYLSNFSHISLKFIIWNKNPHGFKGLEDVYQWGNISKLCLYLQGQTRYTKLITLIGDWYTDYKLVGPILHNEFHKV